MDQDTPQSDKITIAASRESVVRLLLLAVFLMGIGLYCMIDVGKYDKSKDYYGWVANYYGQFIFPAIGAIPLMLGIIQSRRKIVADSTGVSFGARQISWDSITAVDAKQLASKDVLELQYDGGKRVLKAWKWKKFREFVAFLEAHVPADKIIR